MAAVVAHLLGAMALGQADPVEHGATDPDRGGPGSVVVATADPPAQPADPPTATQPAGRRHAWVGAGGPTCRGVGGDSMWLGDYNAFPWRIDLKTGQIDSATVLDGLPGEMVRDTAVLPDGTAAALTRESSSLYLCRPGGRWQAIPRPEPDLLPFSLLLDTEGRLCCLATDRPVQHDSVHHWRDGRWKLVRPVPRCTVAVAVDRGLVLFREVDRVGFLANDTDEVTEWAAFRTNMSPFGRYWLNGRCCVFPQGEWLNGYTTWEKAWWCGPVKLEPAKAKGDLLGLDYQAGDLLELKVLNKTRDQEEFEFPAAPGAQAVRFAPAREGVTGIRILPVRDPTGQLWVGNRRWDGQAWRPVQPDNAMPYRFYDRYPLYRFDPARGEWATDMKGVPIRLIGLDPASRTGWQFERAGENAWRWRLMQLSPDGPKVLRTVESEQWFGDPCFRTPAGEWWFRANDELTRLDDEGAHAVAGEPPSQLLLSPAGNVWVTRVTRVEPFLRYDRSARRFVDAAPWEECSFRFGPWTLARLNDGVNLTRLYVRDRQDQWGPFTELGGTGTNAGPEMIHGRRMIVRVEGVGVVIYDADSNRSVLLDTHRWERVGFDPRGRPLFIGFNSALLFDGDPFAASPLPAELPDLLARMDSRDFREREAATKEMANLAPLHFRLIEDLLTRENLGPEVRWRLDQIVKAPGAEPVGLLRRMHPLLVPATRSDGSR